MTSVICKPRVRRSWRSLTLSSGRPFHVAWAVHLMIVFMWLRHLFTCEQMGPLFALDTGDRIVAFVLGFPVLIGLTFLQQIEMPPALLGWVPALMPLVLFGNSFVVVAFGWSIRWSSGLVLRYMCVGNARVDADTGCDAFLASKRGVSGCVKGLCFFGSIACLFAIQAVILTMLAYDILFWPWSSGSPRFAELAITVMVIPCVAMFVLRRAGNEDLLLAESCLSINQVLFWLSSLAAMWSLLSGSVVLRGE